MPRFAAECRLPSTVTKEQRLLIVNRTLDLLNLRSIAVCIRDRVLCMVSVSVCVYACEYECCVCV